jgi:hypothetical protein
MGSVKWKNVEVGSNPMKESSEIPEKEAIDLPTMTLEVSIDEICDFKRRSY